MGHDQAHDEAMVKHAAERNNRSSTPNVYPLQIPMVHEHKKSMLSLEQQPQSRTEHVLPLPAHLVHIEHAFSWKSLPHNIIVELITLIQVHGSVTS